MELDEWIDKYGWVNHQSGNARVFVATRESRVVAYYALATAGVEKAAAPDSIKKGGVPEHIPCLLLARLAVDRSEHNRGLGRGLLVDAIRRAVRVADDVGARALLIHARDDEARAFYEHQAEFVQSPTDPLHLFLHMKQARKLIGSS
ncbi:MAG: GNAT family N-acetyltransferase [Actinobacteria bacterium]|nr:GNAT family N-acetyltransferase [Actinomycetota bacterium]